MSQASLSCMICRRKTKLLPSMTANLIKFIKGITTFQNITSSDRICSECVQLLRNRQAVLRERKHQLSSQTTTSDSSLSQPLALDSSVRGSQKRRAIEVHGMLQSQSSSNNRTSSSQPLPAGNVSERPRATARRRLSSTENSSASIASPASNISSASSVDYLPALAPRQVNVRINARPVDLIGYRRNTGG